MTKNYYQARKEAAREFAIEWQQENAARETSYSELAYYGYLFSKLARRFGLVREFRENGII